MDSKEAARILQSRLRDVLPDGTISDESSPEGEPTLYVIQENVYRLNVNGQSFFIKWITDQDEYGQNELRTARVFSEWTEVPAPRLLFEKKVKGGVLAGWEWINGHDLRSRDRERLPEVFARLGRHHLEMRNQGRLASPLNEMRYTSVEEMLVSESDRLTAHFDENIRVRCGEIISRLAAGYPTLIHGDVHPGNFLLSDRQIYLVDWSYACNSLNLLDLDYIHSLTIQVGNLPWTIIQPTEAAMVLPAYFRAAGLGHLDPFLTHQAVMVWNLLRNHENFVQNGYRAEAVNVREQLFDLLARI